MAALTLEEGQKFDCSATYTQVVNYLPAYARPRFIRIQVIKFLLCKITNNGDQKSDVSLGPNVALSRQILSISDFSFEPNRKAVQ